MSSGSDESLLYLVYHFFQSGIQNIGDFIFTLMIRSSNGRKELHMESIKRAIEEGKEIHVRFVYQKKFLKVEGFAEIVDSRGKKIDTLLCDDGFSYRLFDIMESKII